VVDKKPLLLKAVNFSNFYHRDLDGSDLLTSPHHSEADFARVRELGFNSVRFAFDGDWYAQAPEVFWTWLDQNVAWARQHDVRLILDLHTPIGGFWLDPTSSAVSFDIWSDPELQKRNVDMWRAIADRYKDEPAVAAYDLLNEPVTLDATGQQWKTLARAMVAAVRSVDPNHLLVVGGLYGVNGRYGTNGIDPHFLVEDANVVYDFHFYEPIKYTHQYASWVEGPMQDGGQYPDPDVIIPTGERTLLSGSAISTPSLPSGTTGWKLYDSGVVPIDDSSAVAAMPVAFASGGMRGTAYFDAITVTEHGPDGAQVREVVNDPLGANDTLNWFHWESGRASPSARLARESSGHKDKGSLSVTDAQGTGAVAGWSNDSHLFKVVPGNRYRIRGYLRGDEVTHSEGAQVGLRLDVYANTPSAAGSGFLERDKAYLEHELMRHLQFGIKNNVPMSVMEFGLVRQAFAMQGKGGDRWVADMVSLFKEHNLGFGYWEYHGAQMGIYLDGTGSAGKLNGPLKEVLARELR
jgi:endoglucanase